MPLDEDPRSGFTGKWTSGIFLALFSIGWGVVSLLSGRLVMSRRMGRFAFEGTPAALLSVALVSFGLYLHFHYFWGTNPKADHISTPGERLFGSLALLFLGGGLCWHFLK